MSNKPEDRQVETIGATPQIPDVVQALTGLGAVEKRPVWRMDNWPDSPKPQGDGMPDVVQSLSGLQDPQRPADQMPDVLKALSTLDGPQSCQDRLPDVLGALGDLRDHPRQKDGIPDTLAALGQFPDFGLRNVFNPATAPIKGMNTWLHQSAVEQPSLLQNVRISDGTIKCRDGVFEFATTGLPATSSGIFRGAYYWKGAVYAAYVSGTRPYNDGSGTLISTQSVIDIYRSSDLVTWTKVTQTGTAKQGLLSSGANAGNNVYGGTDNRLTDYGGNICFTPVVAPEYLDPTTTYLTYGKDLLLCSNGAHPTDPKQSNLPRLLDGDALPAGAETDVSLQRVAIVQDVEAPALQPTDQSLVSLSCFAHVGTNGGTSHVTGGAAGFTLGWGGPNPNGLYTLGTTGSAINTGDLISFGTSSYTTLAGSSATMDLTSGKSFIIAYSPGNNADIASFWDNWLVELGNTTAANWTPIYDPTNYAFDKIIATGISSQWGGGVAIVAFPIPAGMPTNCDAIRLTWKTGTFTPTSSTGSWMYIHTWGVGGFWPGLAQFAITHLNHDAQTESPGVIVPIGGGDKLANVGAAATNNSQLIETDAVYYMPKVPVPSPASAERDEGVDMTLVYRRENGGDTYYQLAESTGWNRVAKWNKATDAPPNAWQWVAPWTAGAQSQLVSIKANDGLNESIPWPDAFIKAIQPFTCADVASSRLVLGSGNTVQVSEYRNGFRHREIVRVVNGYPDLNSASERSFDGETIVNIESVAASMYGANQALIYTDQGTYSIDSGDPRVGASYVGPMGLASRDSLSSFKQTLWFLDDMRQLRRYHYGQSDEPSRLIIEDWLQNPSPELNPIPEESALGWTNGVVMRGIPLSRLGKVATAWMVDKLYVGFSPNHPSTTQFNTRVLVYDSRIDAWYLDIAHSNFSAEQWVVYPDTATGRKRLIAFGHDGRIFEYEQPGATQDGPAGTLQNITIRYWTQEFSDGMWKPLRVNRIGVVCDPLASTTLSATQVLRCGLSTGGNTSTVTASIDLSTGNNGSSVWKWAAPGGGRGVGCEWQFSAPVTAGWRLYSVVAEIESTGGIGANV